MLPRILVAASGSAGTGLDCMSMCLVLRAEFSLSMLDTIQEMGRHGRGREQQGAIAAYFEMCVSLHDCMCVRERCQDMTEKKDGLMTVKEQVDAQSNNLLINLQLCVVNNGCLHQFLERHVMSPTHNNAQEASMEKCGTSCSSCKNTRHDIFLPVSRPGVTKILVGAFFRSGLTLITPLELGRKIRDVNDFNMTSSNTKNKKSRPASHARFDHAAIGHQA